MPSPSLIQVVKLSEVTISARMAVQGSGFAVRGKYKNLHEQRLNLISVTWTNTKQQMIHTNMGQAGKKRWFSDLGIVF
jgi:hypothetical protein